MLFTVRNKAFRESTSKKLKIVNDEKYGIVNTLDNEYLIPKEYDNIFLYGVNTFVLHKNGKIGLCRIDDLRVVIIGKCEYDVIDTLGHNLFLSNDNVTRYYNSNTKEIKDFKEVILDVPYLYGYDEEYQYIIHQESGKVVYKRKYNKYNKSYYVYCGDTVKGAVFYDSTFSTYFYPTDNGYKPYEYPLHHPFIVNKNNVINIVDGENGMGVIDSFGNAVMKNEYNEILLEIKVTAKNGNEHIEKIIEIPNGFFNKKCVSEPDNWI